MAKTVAADLMTRNVLTVRPDMPVGEVAGLILEHRVTAIPVVDEEELLVGIVSEGDLIRCTQAQRTAHRSWWLTLMTGGSPTAADLSKQSQRPVSDVMSKAVLLASEDESLQSLIELLSKRRIKRLPIVRNDKLVGIVSRVDVLRHLAAVRSVHAD